MAVHIIFRSGGLIISMLLGWLVVGKRETNASSRYTVTQILSVLLVTLGVVLTTLSASVPEESSTSTSNPYTYATGIAILTLALLFSGFLGLVQDWTYTKYGRPTQGSPQWQESMFYLHFLALPMFVSVRADLLAQITAVHAGPQMRISLAHLVLVLPKAYLPLLLNTLTQLLCVAGVHRLTTRVSALSVTLVLVVRKAVSLVLSVVGVGMMGHDNSAQVEKGMMWAGAALVLVGTITYSFGSGGGGSGAVAAKGKNKQE
ncbi:hypothetical protein DXG03_006566 [Asterophora parasitica]|uniref:UAA transporter n=1 Tax=Asterophora parasitica TaxID=117018 RepID=A0A9P7G7F7_9AGAR|nr:hypothetical protein DXG03_006566 [Asterophora parasitica]